MEKKGIEEVMQDVRFGRVTEETAAAALATRDFAAYDQETKESDMALSSAIQDAVIARATLELNSLSHDYSELDKFEKESRER